MIENRVIINFPVFELYVENNHLIVANRDYIKDNCVIKLKDILSVEVIRSLTLFDKILEVMMGF